MIRLFQETTNPCIVSSSSFNMIDVDWYWQWIRILDAITDIVVTLICFQLCLQRTLHNYPVSIFSSFFSRLDIWTDMLRKF